MANFTIKKGEVIPNGVRVNDTLHFKLGNQTAIVIEANENWLTVMMGGEKRYIPLF